METVIAAVAPILVGILSIIALGYIIYAIVDDDEGDDDDYIFP